MRLFLFLVLVSTGWVEVCFAHPDPDSWAVREQETLQKTLTLSGAPMRVVVDNVDGYVHVTGTSGSQVRVTAHKLIHAETESDLSQAKSEVSLQMTEAPGSVSVYYDAPWRCNGQGRGCQGTQRRFYNVTYDIDVEVPRAARTVVSTVNNGDVRVDQVDGEFEVSNVNGGIRMIGISGAGDVHTVNGPIAVRFAKNPAATSSFKTVNGSIDVYFLDHLSADLLINTFNGEIYSDFDVSPRPIPAAETEQHDGKFIYRSHGAKAARTGQGGPELSFDSLNGKIRLHREQ